MREGPWYRVTRSAGWGWRGLAWAGAVLPAGDSDEPLGCPGPFRS